MAQHYLLLSKSKNINLKDILRLTEEDAFHLLKTHRWGNTGNIRDVCCPHCGIRHEAYFLESRNVGAANIANAISISLQIPFSLFIRLN